MSIREAFRGDARANVVVKPIDPERPHRFVEQAVGRAEACYFCGRFRASDYHAEGARQKTVEMREGHEV